MEAVLTNILNVVPGWLALALMLGGLAFYIVGAIRLGYGASVRPLVLALLRLVVFVFPLAWVFSRTEQVLTLVWWTFPVAEVLTAAVAAIFLRRAVRNKLRTAAPLSAPLHNGITLSHRKGISFFRP